MAPFYRVFANTLGTGPWFDTFMQNLPPVPAAGRHGRCRLAAQTPVLDKLTAVPKVLVGLLLLAVVAALLVTMRPAPATERAHGVLPAHRRALPGLGGPHPRRPGRRGRVGDPEGEQVKVTMNYERRYDVPADAKAVIISPAIVGRPLRAAHAGIHQRARR